MGNYSMIILIVMMLGMFFLMSRSQKKQQQKRQELLRAMKPGDKVVTIGGLHGLISEINEADSTVTLDCEGIYLVFDRGSIRNVSPAEKLAGVTEEVPAEPEKEEKTEE